LRIDKPNDDSSDFIGRLKVYRIGRYIPENENRTENPDGINCGFSNSNNNSICGEELEYDLNVRQWNGNRLDFTRIDRRPNQNWEQRFRGRIEGNDGQTISGTFTHTGMSRQLNWRGTRAEVLTYGLVQKSRRDRQVWQERTRRQLYHLMMADNPHAISTSMRLGSTVRPRTGTLINRDDNPAANPQEYKLTELFFDYALPNPYDRSSKFIRQSHVWLAVPTRPPPPQTGKYPAAVVVNGHAGSAWLMMQPGLPNAENVSDANASLMYYYGDAFARHGFVVLAVDISHRGYLDKTLQWPCTPPTTPNPPYGPSPLYGRPLHVEDQWAPLGDDMCNSNGPHPFIQAPDFNSSDWEENGERAWDVMRALDYLLQLPYVDPNHVLITGHSLGGEVATIVAALEPRFSMSIPACWSPDTAVFYFNSHGCAHWVNANSREYIDISDYHALIAPRPLIVQTGKKDDIYSKVNNIFFSDHHARFAGDKTVARRSRKAYGDEEDKFIHYLHYDGHRYHFGDIPSPNSDHDYLQDYEQYVCKSSVNEPGQNWPEKLTWQTDPSTINTNRTLFQTISTLR
jgi:dienelactone hydrolase